MLLQQTRMLYVVSFSLLALAAVVVPMHGATVVAVQSGGIVLGSQNTATAGTQAVPWTIAETMTAAGILRLSDTDGTPLGNTVNAFISGNWFAKTVTNNSGITWTSFELELQEILGTPSSDGDGLSFAQSGGFVFSSDKFATVTRIDTTRDYLNFSGGSVLNGQSVTFLFAVTDNSPVSPVYLAQTPNKADVPEPSTISLLGLGAIALFLSLRRRRTA